ncbi:MAG: 3-hydroxyacyl-CoA dehydrogenase [Deltaproteobacteria bacterium]|nr:MAG: 3-hydroxyacyl-CoA dehydrogenase [Deltaproteobacteria bacterium]
MTKPIRRVAVLGAGVMGSGIAAHVANAGIPVMLLDIVPPKLKEPKKASKAERDGFAAGAMKQMLKSKPAALTHKGNAQLIEIGNFDDDLARVKEADLVIEVIIERLDIKQSLFEKLDKLVDGDTIIASNTSGLKIVDMVEGRSERFKKHFMVTHFFNPTRYMKLLELVVSSHTDADVIERVESFGRDVLGKGLVRAKDTPNFIANRIGAHSMMAVIHLMLEHGLAPEDVDAITGLPMGHPKSATFRTGDMVGLDTLVHVVDNCFEVLTDDEDREIFKAPDYIRKMIEKKLLGQKVRSGFYKKGKAGFETFDPKTGDYRPKAGDQDIRKACKALGGGKPADRIRKLVATEGVVGEFAWKAISRSLVYSARRVGEISDDIAAIDDGMRWGYNWELGPFEIWDALGFVETLERMKKDGTALPECITKMHTAGAKAFYSEGRVYDLIKGDYVTQKTDPREIKLSAMRLGKAPVLKNDGAEAWDLGDGVLGVTFKTKANSIDADNVSIIAQAIDRAEDDFRGVLIFNEGEHFCVGANLMLVVMAAQAKQWDQIGEIVKGLQETTQRMKYSQVPVVAAPYGMALGGGLEICLAADAVQAACETYTGPVEVAVGLLPGGAGNLNLLWNALSGIPDGVQADVAGYVTQVFTNIAMAKVATSAEEARRFGYFAKGFGVSFDRARHLHEAKKLVVGMAEAGYHPPIPRAYRLPGESGMATLKMIVNTMIDAGWASEHDGLIANKVAQVLCGGVSGGSHKVTEQEILDLEREAFVSLCGEQKSQERMQHMLMKNKPLRN